jgi:hypothetical protein
MTSEAFMKLEIAIYPSDEGFAACVPSLPGCWSQGATADEAVENIKAAVCDYFEAGDVPPNGAGSFVGTPPGNGPELSEAAEVRVVELAD